MANLITSDWQFQAGTLLLGDGTEYDLVAIDGLGDSAAVTSADQGRSFRQGVSPGRDYLSGRIFTVSFELLRQDPDDLDLLLKELNEALQVGTDEYEIAFQIPGIASGSKAIVNGRVRRRSMGLDLQYAYGNARPVFQVACSDPRIYAASETELSTSLATNSGGRTYDLEHDRSYGVGSTTGTLALANEGNFSAPVSFTLVGPCTDPVIEHVGLGKSLEFDIALADGETLVVDTHTRTVLLGGTSSRYSALRSSSEWFDLEPGANEVTYRAPTPTGSTISASYRSAWS